MTESQNDDEKSGYLFVRPASEPVRRELETFITDESSVPRGKSVEKAIADDPNDKPPTPDHEAGLS